MILSILCCRTRLLRYKKLTISSKIQENIICTSLSKSYKKILYSSNIKGNYQVFSYDTEKNISIQITQNLENKYFANSYVLNDKGIIYQKYNTKDNGNLFLYILSTKVEKRLTQGKNKIIRFIKKVSEDKIMYQKNNELCITDLRTGICTDTYSLNSKYIFLDYDLKEEGWILLDKHKKSIILIRGFKTKVLVEKTNIDNTRLIGFKNLTGYLESAKIDKLDKAEYIIFEKSFKNNKKQQLFISKIPVKHIIIGKEKILTTFEIEKNKRIVLFDLISKKIVYTFTEDDAHKIRNLYFDTYKDYLILGISTNNSQLQFYIINKDNRYKLHLNHIKNFKGVDPEKIKIRQNQHNFLYGNIYYPRNHVNGAIIYLHGGPTIHVSSTYNGLFQSIISHGWVILELDYHGSTGYGSNFEKSINKRIGTLEILDCIDAVNYLKKLPDLKSKRIGIGGDSYGGFLTLLALEKANDLFAFGFAINGISDWVSFLNKLPMSLFPERTYIYKKFGNPIKDYLHLYSVSPINMAYMVKAPLLIIHGKKDERVPVSQSINMYKKLKDFNENVQLEVLQEADHTLSAISVQQKVFKKIIYFLKNK